VRVDGVPSVPACRIDLKPGMSCERQNGPLGSVDSDLFRAVDFLFRGGLDHHHIMIQSRLLGKVTLEVARRLAGLGTLPDKPAPDRQGSLRAVPLVIIGAGPAGLAAAQAALEAGVPPGAGAETRVLVLERNRTAGGAARLGLAGLGAGDGGATEQAQAARLAETKGAEILFGGEVVGLYADESPQGDALLAVRHQGRLLAVRARRVILATGGTPQPLPFSGVDRPGVYAARGLLEMFVRTGVRVGDKLAVVGEGPELVLAAKALQAAGYGLAAVIDAGDGAVEPSPADASLPIRRATPVRVRGNPAAELQIELPDKGKVEKLRCDAVAIALPPAPLHDLATSVGAQAEFDQAQGGFPVHTDERGRAGPAWLFAAGTVAGESGAEALLSGAAAGRTAGGEAAALSAAAQAGGAGVLS
jgi:sarcosine oxidase subunit alpha